MRWKEDEEWSGFLDRNYSIYEYNEFLKEFIARYKYRGDYVLAKVFSETVIEKLRTIKYDLISYIPLSQERLHERGFNQSEAIIKEAGKTPSGLLQRTHSEKQSKKSRQDRIHLPQVFQVKRDLDLTNKKILLVDDIYTTGSTLRHAAKVLKQSGAISISSLTIAR
ncbi:ComF family protein [Bacillus sp. 31A1R]|uniref:ComF family protein n=1 Tax=Robertmurraya mangrovi TaxID=3098077 RepID=A0ABU5IXT5_9BACI|nr:ComF family protein [Bacillus sp. 31A1R]